MSIQKQLLIDDSLLFRVIPSKFPVTFYNKQYKVLYDLLTDKKRSRGRIRDSVEEIGLIS